jgi:hypothetical protein
MRPLDHFDLPDPEPPTRHSCDQCAEREAREGEFFYCRDCGQVLCPETLLRRRPRRTPRCLPDGRLT